MRLSCTLLVVCCLLTIVSGRAGSLYGREFMIDTLERHTQWNPAVAFDGTNFLVVWEDRRPSGEGTYCSRVNPTTGVLDPVGIPVSVKGGLQCYPEVAFDGTNYLVVWEQWDANLTTSDIHCARVSPLGQVLDSIPIVVSDAPGCQIHSAVAFDGENYLVCWTDCRNEPAGDIYGARVTPAGTVLDTAGIVISAAPNHQLTTGLAFDGTNYLPAWSDFRGGSLSDIYGTRVTPAGEVLDTAGIGIGMSPDGDKRSEVASCGTNFIVVWDIERGPSGIGDVYAARIDRTGATLDSTGIPVAVGYDYPRFTAVAYDGTDYFVAWRRYVIGGTPSPCLFGARVSPAGEVDSTITLVVHNYAVQRPRVACGGGVMFVVYVGWTYIIDGKYYGRDRIWGKFGPFPGAGEEPAQPPAHDRQPKSTIVRAVLNLTPASNTGRSMSSRLFDMSGRKVMELVPGPNDVRQLAPGVYFVQETSGTRKVILTRE